MRPHYAAAIHNYTDYIISYLLSFVKSFLGFMYPSLTKMTGITDLPVLLFFLFFRNVEVSNKLCKNCNGEYSGYAVMQAAGVILTDIKTPNSQRLAPGII